MVHFVYFFLFGGKLPRSGSEYRAANDPEVASHSLPTGTDTLPTRMTKVGIACEGKTGLSIALAQAKHMPFPQCHSLLPK